MSEHRFRDPQGNEWVTLDDPTAEILDGYPLGTVEIAMAPVQPVSLDQAKAMLKASIDSAAEIERMKYITTGSGQAMTYMQKADEARSYLAATDPVPTDYPLISAEVGITAETIQEVAAIVNAAFTQWQQIGAAIEAARLGTKVAIEAATAAEEAQAAADAVAWPSP